MLSNELTKHHRNLSTSFSPKKGSANKKYYRVYLTAHSFNVQSKPVINRATFTKPCIQNILGNKQQQKHKTFITNFPPKKDSANKNYYHRSRHDVRDMRGYISMTMASRFLSSYPSSTCTMLGWLSEAITSSSSWSSSFNIGLLNRRNLHAYWLPEFLSITLRTMPAEPLG